MNYVIIGNSAAAVGCVEGIRRVDKEGKITLISDEKHHTYSRPLISYLLWGHTDEERMKYRPDSFYKDNKVKKMLGKKVVAIDKDAKVVKLDNGNEVAYDKLLVATGSRPFIPPMEGYDNVSSRKKFTFMTLDEAKALDKALKPDSRVLVIGAGLIGLKCVEGIFEKVGSVTVVDLATRILPSILDDEGSALIQKSLEEKGVKFILGTSAAKFESSSAVLTNGETVDFDILVMAVGVRPNVELVKEIGGNVNRGIITDEYCKTSLPDIWSAGDCTESFDISSGSNKVMALLPNAYMQGEVAGISMASETVGVADETLYNKGIPMNAIGFFGYHVITAGSYTGECYTKVEGSNYKKLFYSDNHLNGYILIGDVARAGIYTKLIRERTPLDSIDFELIKDKPQLMAFSKAERAKQLAGAK